MQVLYSDLAYGACNVCAQRPQRVAGLFPSVGVVPVQHTHRRYNQKGRGSHHLPCASAVATGGNGDEDDDDAEASRQQLSRNCGS